MGRTQVATLTIKDGGRTVADEKTAQESVQKKQKITDLDIVQ